MSHNPNLPANVPASLEVYDKISNPMEAVKALGESIFKSGLFGCVRQEQGEVLAMQCLAERKSPLELMRTYHFVDGKLVLKADALLAKFLLSGGKVEWKERTDTRVVGVFSRPGQAGVEIVADIEEYKRNGNAMGKGGIMKDNWAKWPRRMLTARAISEGVRLVAPDCCFGLAVAEESETGFKPRTEVNLDISDLIPPGKEQKAIDLLISLNFLQEGQGLEDLEPGKVKALRKWHADSFTAQLLKD